MSEATRSGTQSVHNFGEMYQKPIFFPRNVLDYISCGMYTVIFSGIMLRFLITKLTNSSKLFKEPMYFMC